MDQEVVVQNGDTATNHVQDLPPPPPYVNLSLCFVVTFSEFECLHTVMQHVFTHCFDDLLILTIKSVGSPNKEWFIP